MWEILVVFALLFIVVGPGKLPGLAKKLGEQIRGLKSSLADVKATVDQNDEFVKAVADARNTVNEAKGAVRDLIDEVVNVAPTMDELEEEFRDPAPKPVSKGRKRVDRPGKASETDEDDEVAQDGAPEEARRQKAYSRTMPRADLEGPTMVEEPVEAEDWRASSREDRTAQAVQKPRRGSGAARSSGSRADKGGVPNRTQRRGAAGRRMIKPGRGRAGDGD